LGRFIQDHHIGVIGIGTVNKDEAEWILVGADDAVPYDFINEINQAGIIFPSSDAANVFGGDMTRAENVCISNVSIFGKEATSIGAFRIGDKYFHYFIWDHPSINIFAKLMRFLIQTVREKFLRNRISIDMPTEDFLGEIADDVIAELQRITVNDPERDWTTDVCTVPVRKDAIHSIPERVRNVVERLNVNSRDTSRLFIERDDFEAMHKIVIHKQMFKKEERERMAKELIEEVEQDEKLVKRKNQKPPNATKQANKIRDMEKKKAAEFAKDAAKKAALKTKSDYEKVKRKQMKKLQKNHQN
jgi:hypothetical protein